MKSLSRQELNKIWTQFFEEPPPNKLHKAHMIKHIEWGQKYGKLDPKIEKQLDKLVTIYAKSKDLKINDIKKIQPLKIATGTKLIREFKGIKHEVITLEKGFEYKGQTYKSLSAIANQITGTRWNGRKFFGLK